MQLLDWHSLWKGRDIKKYKRAIFEASSSEMPRVPGLQCLSKNDAEVKLDLARAALILFSKFSFVLFSY